jgi:uncharacterized protein
MPTRRLFLAGLTASAALPRVTWADAGAPSYLAAARIASGAYRLCGLDEGGRILFDLPLPDRGHAAAAHPERPEAVAFARRPGTFALVIDCVHGTETARLKAPPNRHFYGHGAVSSDGAILYTTENDLDTLEGRIGLWDAADGYARMGDVPSGGIGPHDLLRLPGTELLVVANGGMATHPDSGRVTLNLATMRANLAYVDPAVGRVEVVELAPDMRRNSIRHLAVAEDGLVAAAMQWQGPETEHPPLVLTHRRGAPPRLMAAPEPEHRLLANYAGSVAFSGDGEEIAITSPRGNRLHRFSHRDGGFLGALAVPDVCGVARHRLGGLLITSGTGAAGPLVGGALHAVDHAGRSWDNHVVDLGS